MPTKYANSAPGFAYNQLSAGDTYFADTMEEPKMNPMATGADAPGSPVDSTPIAGRSVMGKPATWWVMLVAVLAVFIFVSRKFGGPEKFGNIKLTLWNGIFAVLFYVIVLNFLKVTFSFVKVPGLSELVAAA